MEKIRKRFIAAMHFLELCHFTLHMLMMFIAKNAQRLVGLFLITISRKSQKNSGGRYNFFKQPIEGNCKKCLATIGVFKLGNQIKHSAATRHFFDKQSKKRLSDHQAFFGWAIEENTQWPNVSQMGNYRKHLVATAHLLDMQWKKTFSNSHAYFGWVIKEIAWQLLSISSTGNQKKRLVAIKCFVVEQAKKLPNGRQAFFK